MLLLRAFMFACRRIGFWKALFVSVSLLVFLSLAVQAFAAPPAPPPASSVAAEFFGTPATVCKADHSFCPGNISLLARLTNGASRVRTPAAIELHLDYFVAHCMDVTCGNTMLESPDLRPVLLFVDGRSVSHPLIVWHQLESYFTFSSQQIGAPGRVFVSDPLLSGADQTIWSAWKVSVSDPVRVRTGCGWHRINVGIVGDSGNGGDSLDGQGHSVHYDAHPASVALSPSLAIYGGDCSPRRAAR